MSYIENLDAVKSGAGKSQSNEVLIHVQKEFFQESRTDGPNFNEAENEKTQSDGNQLP